MKVIAGLGNPGSRYAPTRHNVGFMVVDRLAGRLRSSFRAGKGDYEWTEFLHGDERALLVKPMTFMNNSGEAVRDVVQFFKVSLFDVLVVCDDAALPLGRMRLRPQGSDGGQNGLKSVILHLNTDRFPRLRIGISNEHMAGMDLADFVLSRFTEKERDLLPLVVDSAADAALMWCTEGSEKVMNRYNAMVITN